jgi:FkbM family methyltransferase
MTPSSTNYWGWRLRLLRAKARGQAPEIGWGDLAVSMIPKKLVDRWRVVMDRVPPSAGRVTMVRRDGDFVLWRSELGNLWGRYTDGRAIAAFLEEQLDERAYDLDPVCVRAGDVVIDAGANLGVFTQFALQRGASQVVAFEPNRALLQCLEKSFAEEIRSGRLRLIDAALWHTRELLKFNTEGPHAGGRLAADGAVEVQAVTLDEIVEKLALARVDFIKMDIEGAERHALPGAARTIRRFHPRMTICSYHYPDDIEVLPELMRGIAPEYTLIRRRDHDYYYDSSAEGRRAHRPGAVA